MLTLSLLFVLSCAHHRKPLKQGCEAEFYKTELSQGEAIWQKVAETGSSGASYLITGLGYSTDVLVSFTGGVVGAVTVCSPLLAVEFYGGRSGNHSDATGYCLGEVGSAVVDKINPNLGPRARKSTEKWRCPNTDPIAEGLLKVATCYKEKGEAGLAQEQLKKIKETYLFDACISEGVKEKINRSLELL